MKPQKELLWGLPIVSIVVPFLVNQDLYYRILTIKLVTPKKGTTMETLGMGKRPQNPKAPCTLIVDT